MTNTRRKVVKPRVPGRPKTLPPSTRMGVDVENDALAMLQRDAASVGLSRAAFVNALLKSKAYRAARKEIRAAQRKTR